MCDTIGNYLIYDLMSMDLITKGNFFRNELKEKQYSKMERNNNFAKGQESNLSQSDSNSSQKYKNDH
jgi:hypothetical protein